MWRQMHTSQIMPHTTSVDPQMILLLRFILSLLD